MRFGRCPTVVPPDLLLRESAGRRYMGQFSGRKGADVFARLERFQHLAFCTMDFVTALYPVDPGRDGLNPLVARQDLFTERPAIVEPVFRAGDAVAGDERVEYQQAAGAQGPARFA